MVAGMGEMLMSLSRRNQQGEISKVFSWLQGEGVLVMPALPTRVLWHSVGRNGAG